MEGLTTSIAMKRLHEDIEEVLASDRANSASLGWAAEAWLPGSSLSLFHLTSVVLGLLISLALLASSPSASELATAVVVLIFLAANFFLSGWESYQRSQELRRRVARIASLVEEVGSGEGWSPEHYPPLHSPPSASILLQWTERDGALINLPWALLVRDDVIHLRPGQVAPG